MNFMTVLFLIIKPVVLTNFIIQERPCDTVEIRKYEELDLLNNCTVVIGNVNIIFPIIGLSYYSREQIFNRTFPLREVTGYMLLYNIIDVESPGKMFPNLTIIRGARLFHNYALVISDTDFEEIGFRNLLKISRGSVRIAGSNPRLCMPKIDWDSILLSGHVVIIGDNIVRSDCDMQFQHCHSCEKPGLCWSNRECQRFDKTLFVPGSKKLKCHPLCLGKCVNETAKGCYVCRDKSELGECVQACSDFRFYNSDTKRCITGEECKKLGRKIYNRECVQNCPSNYMIRMKENEMVPADNFCIPCLEKCPKICSNLPEIKTIAQLESIGSGCTIINGSLEINFVEDASNLTAEMQVYLGDIEEIHGALKIHRSTPLTSLTFLNKLKRVYGLNNVTAPYSIRIFDNQNLQSFFDWRLRNDMQLELVQGAVQISRNYMLCETEVELFELNLNQIEDAGINYISNNGNSSTCRKRNIKTYSKVLSHDSVAIGWEDLPDNRTMKRASGYIIQYVPIDVYEMKEFDENLLYERDICSAHGWKNVILELDPILSLNKSDDSDFPNATMSYVLTGLTQYTYYAFTLQRYSYNSFDFMPDFNNSFNGISEVKVFQTFMNIPSRVAKFSAIIKTSNSITLKWSVLEKEENVIERYLLYYYKKPILYEHLDARDYCLYPINFDEISVIDIKSENIINELNMNDKRCCEKCCKNQKKRNAELENDENIFGYSIVEHSETFPRPNPEEHRSDMKNKAGFHNLISFTQDIKMYTVTNLTAFTTYGFHIYVCAAHCSEYELLYERTAMDETYDQIELNPVDQEYHGEEFRVKFKEPKHKNGEITSYIIEIHEIKESMSIPRKTECISRQKHKQNKYEFVADEISEGNYIFRIMAISLAQKGPFTDWHRYKVGKTTKETPIGLIFSISMLLSLIFIIAITYYYKHKITNILRRQNDTALLIKEMEPTDFNEISMNHNSFDHLSDILEHEDE